MKAKDIVEVHETPNNDKRVSDSASSDLQDAPTYASKAKNNSKQYVACRLKPNLHQCSNNSDADNEGFCTVSYKCRRQVKPLLNHKEKTTSKKPNKLISGKNNSNQLLAVTRQSWVYLTRLPVSVNENDIISHLEANLNSKKFNYKHDMIPKINLK
ncbi:hypothetical protein J6590_093521 [Homalodisca vitripennis]|nr:hypothetical protein J6590_093521 [Homalodisca vitripennis]